MASGFRIYYGKIKTMNIYDMILRDNPYCAYNFNVDAASYPTISGTAAAALTTTAPRNGVSFVSAPSLPLVLGGTTTAKIPCSRFQGESTGFAFTLMSWVYIQATTAVSIMSHTGIADGLYFDGTYISFTLKHTSGSDTVARWKVPTFRRAYMVHGVYDKNRVALYINGELKSAVEITNTNPLVTYADTFLYAGQSSAGQYLLFEAPAIFNYALGAESVARHWLGGRQNTNVLDAASEIGGGFVFRFADEDRELISGDAVNFDLGYSDGALTSDGVLVPIFDQTTGLSLSGTWKYSVTIPQGITSIIGGVKFEWESLGTFTIEYTTNNGTNWTALTNGDVILNGAAQTTDLDIRVTFPSGAARDSVYISSMNITVYKNAYVNLANYSGRVATLLGAAVTASGWSEPIEWDEYSGLRISGAGNYARIGVDTNTDIQNIYAVEGWVKFDAVGGGVNAHYIVDSTQETPSNAGQVYIGTGGFWQFAGGTLYVDGASRSNGAYAAVAKRPQHFVFVYTTPHNAPIAIGSASNAFNVNGVVYNLNLHTVAPTAADVATLFDSYQGPIWKTVDDATAITVTETAGGTKAYAYDWSIQAANV